MKKIKDNRDAVIGRKDSICIAASKEFKQMVEEKSNEMGLSISSFVRMAVKEFTKNH